jgi:hypothetical protein
MRARSSMPVARLAPRPLYTANELARAAGVSLARFLRLLRAFDVRVFPVESIVWVPLWEIESKLSPLWESIALAAEANHRCGASRLRTVR